MPKKTTILIVILAVVTGVLLFLAITNGNQKQSSMTTILPTTPPVEKTAKVFFSPQNLDLSTGSANAQSVDIMVDTGKGGIVGVQAELQFDPKALTSVKLIPTADATGFFGSGAVILFNDVNLTTGRISYAIAIGPSQKPIKGVGKIATLSFQKGYASTSNTTIISFLNKTLVTTLGQNESVLQATTPLNIVLSSPTRQYAPVSVYPSAPAVINNNAPAPSAPAQ